MYEDALQDYIKILDYKIDNGYDLDNIENKIENKRIEDTYRVISLSFSYLGGAESIVEFFDKHGHRFYEASIYSHLGEYYLTKRRYTDAAQSYQAYIDRNPVSKESPYFNIRIIEIYKSGGFPRLVVDAKRDFSKTYSLNSNYWTFFDINEKYKIEAEFELTPNTPIFEMQTTTERAPLYKKYGIARFTLDGNKIELSIYQSLDLKTTTDYNNYLFLLFNDASNNKTSYGGGRFIDLESP